MPNVLYQDLGVVDYTTAWRYQEHLLAAVVDRKMENRQRSKNGQHLLPIQHYLLCCEHPPVFTLGRSGSPENLLLSEPNLKDKGFQYFKINRGGDITYHGPGQIVMYPIFDLDDFFTDIHKYVRYLEEIVIQVMAGYGLSGSREKGYTGVWLAGNEQEPARKICAIGVHLRRWVTLHGFAFNIQTDLSHFDFIVPCGIDESDRDVTSLEKELGQAVDFEEVKMEIKRMFARQFSFSYQAEDLLQAALPVPLSASIP